MILSSMPLTTSEDFFLETLMTYAPYNYCGLFVEGNGSKWLFDGKRLPTPELDDRL